MDKREFIKIFKESLSGSLEKDAIDEQVVYYENYIDSEIKNGKTEKEVLDELGDPRLIAKTIKTVNKNAITYGNNEDSYDESDSRSYEKRTYTGYDNSQNSSTRNKQYVYDTGTIGCIIGFLVLFIIMMLIFRIFGTVLYGLGSVALSGPIGFILVIALLYFLFGGGRRR